MDNKTEITGAEILIRTLQANHVDTIFGYPGGAVLPIYDALFNQNALRHILTRHEQGAIHAAEGYARSTGKVGVVLVTSGPGATNTVTGLTDALLDSVPIVCITGQVPTHLIGSDAFQECDTTGITRPCTKHNWLVRDIDKLEHTINEAFYVAQKGRPGPVLIDIPKDIQFAKTKPLKQSQIKYGHKTYKPQTDPDKALLDQAFECLLNAKKPIIYAGGGVINAGKKACSALDELVQLINWPITLTLMGLGAFPAKKTQFLGMLGMHGTYEANMAMHDCDVMLALGVRFDDRITGRLDAFSPHSNKIQIDIDPSSINKNVKVNLGIVGDVGQAIEYLVKRFKDHKDRLAQQNLVAWWDQVDQWRKRQCLSYHQTSQVIKPQHAIKRLGELISEREFYITTEVGQHQMWAAQYLPFNKPFHWMTSGGLGTMGYGLPAAIGVQLAHPDALVIDIAGEASILMNIQELSTACQFEAPVKVFIINNQYMGMVRQWQELLHGGRYSHSYSSSLPDFVKLAEAYGIKGIRISKLDELDDGIAEMISSQEPVLVDVAVDPSENCFPMIPSGSAHNEMLFSQAQREKHEIDVNGQVLV